MSETQNSPALEMRGVTVTAMRDASLAVIEDVNWSVGAGEFWVVAGPEHSGKSDLLALAAGLMPPGSGNCKLFGNDTSHFGEAELAGRLRAGLVFERGQLFNQLTIAENIALPLRYHKDITPTVAAEKVKSLLEVMELTPLADVTPSNVAANWRQRAALARALVLKPELLLLDNPLAGLGARHRQWWQRFLEQLARGHSHYAGKPLTMVVTADDLSHFAGWENPRQKFAVLRDKKFIPLGAWSDVEVSHDAVVKELLAAPWEATI